jgi:hypothetical protein
VVVAGEETGRRLDVVEAAGWFFLRSRLAAAKELEEPVAFVVVFSRNGRIERGFDLISCGLVPAAMISATLAASFSGSKTCRNEAGSPRFLLACSSLVCRISRMRRSPLMRSTPVSVNR